MRDGALFKSASVNFPLSYGSPSGRVTLRCSGETAFGMSADLGADQLASIEQALRDAIEEAQEAERSKRWPCGIGPYANGICTICGGAQP